MFEIELWNMNQRTIDLLMRTNNLAEAWYRRLSSSIQYQHPTLWIFMNNIKTEEHFIHCQLIKLNSRQRVDPNEKYLNYSIHLCHLIKNPLPSILQELEGLVHTL